jgi:hypothetical protein
MNRIKRECDCFLSERKTGLGPMRTCVSLPLTTLNRPDVHQEIVDRYAKYSENYWAGVRVRQKAYLQELRAGSCNSSVYRVETPFIYSSAVSIANTNSEKGLVKELISIVQQPEIIVPKSVDMVDISCNSCLKK